LPLSIHQTRIYRTLEDLESLRPAWEDLLAAFSGATTFSTWEWLAAWWNAFSKGRELLVLAFFDESASLVGMAPLAISRREVMPFLKLRVLSLLGDGSGDSDNLDFPVRAGWEDPVVAALLDLLAKESKQWDLCEFNTMPAESPIGNRLTKMLGDRRWGAYREQRASSAISLPATWEEYLGRLSSKERGKITYYRKRLQKNYEARSTVARGKARSQRVSKLCLRCIAGAGKFWGKPGASNRRPVDSSTMSWRASLMSGAGWSSGCSTSTGTL
jgi:hypothetical protein